MGNTLLILIFVIPALIVFGIRFLRSGQPERIAVDGAYITIVGQDIFVRPRRTRTALISAAVILFCGAMILLLIANFISALVNKALDTQLFLVSGVSVFGLAFVLRLGYFNLKRGLAQRAVHFDAKTQTITIGKDTPFPYDQVVAVFVGKQATVELGISGSMLVVMTGIVIAPDTLIPIASISESREDKIITRSLELVKLYGKHLGKAEYNQDLKKALVIQALDADQTVMLGFGMVNAVSSK